MRVLTCAPAIACTRNQSRRLSLPHISLCCTHTLHLLPGVAPAIQGALHDSIIIYPHLSRTRPGELFVQRPLGLRHVPKQYVLIVSGAERTNSAARAESKLLPTRPKNSPPSTHLQNCRRHLHVICEHQTPNPCVGPQASAPRADSPERQSPRPPLGMRSVGARSGVCLVADLQ